MFQSNLHRLVGATALLLLWALPARAVTPCAVAVPDNGRAVIDLGRSNTAVRITREQVTGRLELTAPQVAQIQDCRKAKVIEGQVIVGRGVRNPRSVGDALLENDDSNVGRFAATLRKILLGATQTRVGGLNSHEDSRTLPGFPTDKILYPDGGEIRIPFWQLPGRLQAFQIVQANRAVSYSFVDGQWIVIPLSAVAINQSLSWIADVDGVRYSDDFSILSPALTAEVAGLLAQAEAGLGADPGFGVRGMTRAAILREQGLGMDAAAALAPLR